MSLSGGAAIHEARAISSTLKRVRQNVEIGVLNAEEAASVLDDDNKTIKETLDIHKYDLKNNLRTTKTRMNQLKSSESWEKYSVFLSLGFFTLVVVYIIGKRMRLFTIVYLFIAQTLYLRNSIDPRQISQPLQQVIQNNDISINEFASSNDGKPADAASDSQEDYNESSIAEILMKMNNSSSNEINDEIGQEIINSHDDCNGEGYCETKQQDNSSPSYNENSEKVAHTEYEDIRDNNADNDIDRRFSKKTEDSSTTVYIVGSRVEGNYLGEGYWFPGEISRVRGKGLYDILYDDGGKEPFVPTQRIQHLKLDSSHAVDHAEL